MWLRRSPGKPKRWMGAHSGWQRGQAPPVGCDWMEENLRAGQAAREGLIAAIGVQTLLGFPLLAKTCLEEEKSRRKTVWVAPD